MDESPVLEEWDPSVDVLHSERDSDTVTTAKQDSGGSSEGAAPAPPTLPRDPEFQAVGC